MCLVIHYILEIVAKFNDCGVVKTEGFHFVGFLFVVVACGLQVTECKVIFGTCRGEDQKY